MTLRLLTEKHLEFQAKLEMRLHMQAHLRLSMSTCHTVCKYHVTAHIKKDVYHNYDVAAVSDLTP